MPLWVGVQISIRYLCICEIGSKVFEVYLNFGSIWAWGLKLGSLLYAHGKIIDLLHEIVRMAT